jgi:hypothetical protein
LEDDFVVERAFDFNKVQQLSTNGMQQVPYQSLKNNKCPQAPDQGVGGSNPLSPINPFQPAIT